MTPRNTDQSITVILPCAGEGSRLGLKTPKEVLEIDFQDNRSSLKLIDFSLSHINTFENPEQLTVVPVIRPWKKEVADYVESRLQGIRVKSVMFDDRYNEWPGSVYSASPLFSDYNIVLLPDSFLSLTKNALQSNLSLKDEKGQSLIALMVEALKKNAVVFGAIACQDSPTLQSLGAMRVENGLVTAFQDKPQTSLDFYNAFWGCYGFRKAEAEELYHFLTASVHHQSDRRAALTERSFYPPGTIPIAEYYDLGTWERIELFKTHWRTETI